MANKETFINPALVQNLGKELLNLVGTEVAKANTSLYERKSLNFRDIIDNSFPTMLVIDYSGIKTELKMYQDIDTALKTYISESYTPTQKDYAVNKFSDKEIDLILRAIRLGIKQVSATPISYKVLQTQLESIIASDLATSTTVQKVNQLFAKTYKLTDVAGDVEVFIFPNFARIGDILRKPLDIGLSIAEEEASLSINNLSSIGTILNYGHTAVGYTDDTGTVKLNFNSPKVLAVMFDVIQSAGSSAKATALQNSLEAATFFVNDTRQSEVYINIDKNFSDGFVSLFVSVGGNAVRFENSLINSRRGSVLEKTEKRGVNKAVLERLATAFRDSSSAVGSRLARYILNKKSSPSLIDYIQYNITAILEGKPVGKYRGSSKGNSQTIVAQAKKQVVSGLVKNKVKLPKIKAPQTKIPNNIGGPSLSSLQLLINKYLQDVISASMGRGDSKTVLNYRTGRFASTVKVERVSKSREGMITAFYSYMKNPYATFSEGGQQQYPKTRDPKLLIASSIREIAAQQAVTRMRAVAV